MQPITPVISRSGEYPPLDIEQLTDEQAVTLCIELHRMFYMSASIHVLDLSMRPINVLRRLKVETIGDLYNIPSEDLSRCKGLGSHVRDEVRKAAIAWCGFELKNWEEGVMQRFKFRKRPK